MTPLRPAACNHCSRSVVWANLQNGRARSFEPEPRRLVDIAATEAFAYSRRLGAMVCLDGERNPPSHALVPHYCAEYRQAKVDERLDAELLRQS